MFSKHYFYSLFNINNILIVHLGLQAQYQFVGVVFHDAKHLKKRSTVTNKQKNKE